MAGTNVAVSEAEVVMSERVPWVTSSETGDSNAKRREEIDGMLDAIVGAIVAGRLPPDDACAWAKIAAYEVEMLGLTPSSSVARQN
jgi:hypothetical protein